MKRYYISHPYTGDEEKNKMDADRIRAALKEAHPGICFMNPLGMFGNKDTDYFIALADAMELLSVCDAVIFCPGWENSCGCRAEKAFVIQQGIKIMYLKEFSEVMYRLRDNRIEVELKEAMRAEIDRQEAMKSIGRMMMNENRHDG